MIKEEKEEIFDMNSPLSELSDSFFDSENYNNVNENINLEKLYINESITEALINILSTNNINLKEENNELKKNIELIKIALYEIFKNYENLKKNYYILYNILIKSQHNLL